MAAITALQDYGSDSSDDDSIPDQNLEDFSLHLKPINTSDKNILSSSSVQVEMAPIVAVKVRFFVVPIYKAVPIFSDGAH